MSDTQKMIEALRKQRDEEQRRHDELLAELRRLRDDQGPSEPFDPRGRMRRGYEENERRVREAEPASRSARSATERRPMTTSKTEQLAAMRSQAHDAVKRVTELEAERLKAQRSVERVKAPLRDYFEQLGAGEIEPDPKTERKLREAVARAESVVSMRPRLTGGHVTDFEVVDDQIEAQLAGARRAAEQRHADVRGFIDEHRAELLAERFPAWQETGRRYGAAIEELLEADGERAHAIRECIELGVPTEELPPRLFPLDPQAVGDYRATRQRDPGSLVPAPRWLTSDEEAT